MLSDMVCRGPFHHRSMTSGERNTTPATTVQFSSDCGLPTMHTALAASAQAAANLTFICSSCMLEGYGTLRNAAVPKRTARDRAAAAPRLASAAIVSGPAEYETLTDGRGGECGRPACAHALVGAHALPLQRAGGDHQHRYSERGDRRGVNRVIRWTPIARLRQDPHPVVPLCDGGLDHSPRPCGARLVRAGNEERPAPTNGLSPVRSRSRSLDVFVSVCPRGTPVLTYGEASAKVFTT